jgi:hypothetical protein
MVQLRRYRCSCHVATSFTRTASLVLVTNCKAAIIGGVLDLQPMWMAVTLAMFLRLVDKTLLRLSFLLTTLRWSAASRWMTT